MKDNIRFKGLTLNRDEQGVEHGECALCGGVEVHDGALRPSVLQGTTLAGGASIGGKLLYVHQTDDYTMFICLTEDTYHNEHLYAYWENGNSWGSQNIDPINFSPDHILSVKSVGNTLVVMKQKDPNGNIYDDGLHYFLCHNDGTTSNNNGWSYKYLGQQPPFLQIQFNLDYSSTYAASNVEEHKYKVKGEYFFDDDIDPNLSTIHEEERSPLTEHVLGHINKEIDRLCEHGLFYAPFLIRYCYRMTMDNSMIMHSAPVLMMPMLHHPVLNFSTTLSTSLSTYNPAQGDEIAWCQFLSPCRLQAKILNTSISSALNDWKDVIRSVDIFITPQFSRIDTSKLIEKVNHDTAQEFNYSLWEGTENDIPALYESTYAQFWSHAYQYSWKLPEYDENDYFSRIRKASYFYKLTSIELEDIGTDKLDGSFRRLQFEASILHNIAVQPQMVDDYKTHNKLIPASDQAGLYVYNERLNVYGISERLFKGFSMYVLFPYTGLSASVYTVRTYIKTDSGTFAVENNEGGFGASAYSNWLINNGFIFYPDARATAMMITATGVTVKRRLTDSDELNGSLSFCDDSAINDLPSFINSANPGVTPSVPSNNLAVVPLTNKIYTSRAGNPFYFPNLVGEVGINTVGIGHILGLAVVTRPLSTGQVGDHDLIVFCTDGIWVAKVSNIGTYTNLHNISREICDNQKSVCQLDQSVVFATSRALNRFIEDNVINFSEVLDGPYFDVKNKLAAFAAEYCIDPGEGEDYPANYDFEADALIRFATPPINYFKNGQVLYDYIGNRLIILPAVTDEGSVGLVFSIRDKAWSTMVLPPILAAVNNYPHPYVQTIVDHTPNPAERFIIRLDTPYSYTDATQHTGVVVTRTLTYSDTMDVVRGFRQLTDGATMPILYFFGSNDQRTWQFIGKSQRSFHNYIPGHPFRFFRIAMYIRLKTSEKYQQLIMEMINKYTKL